MVRVVHTSVCVRLPLQVTISKYEGFRSADGLFEGTGCAEFTSGNTYEGTFQRGQMHGQGKYIWTDGLTYCGSFVNNKVTGTGVRVMLVIPVS